MSFGGLLAKGVWFLLAVLVGCLVDRLLGTTSEADLSWNSATLQVPAVASDEAAAYSSLMVQVFSKSIRQR